MCDEQLIADAKQGNEHAFRQLIEMYKDQVYRSVYSVLRDAKDAEDAAQETFIRAYYALPQYHGKGFKTWITRIAVNYAIDYKRKAERRPVEMRESTEMASNQSLAEEVEMKEQRELVKQRLKQIPDRYRDVIYEFYINEKSYQEIAVMQNVEVKTIETKLYRARSWLKKNWKEEDF